MSRAFVKFEGVIKPLDTEKNYDNSIIPFKIERIVPQAVRCPLSGRVSSKGSVRTFLFLQAKKAKPGKGGFYAI